MNLHRYLRFLRPNPEADLDDELAFHMQARIDEYIASGMTRDRATAEAERRFGNFARIRNQCVEIDNQATREATVKDVLQTTIADFSFALRQLRSTRALTAAAVLCLALGIGATTAIFSVVDTVLFRPLPFRDADRLVVIGEELPKIGGGNFGTISAPDYLEFSTLDGRIFESSAVIDNAGYTITGPEGPERLKGAVMRSSMLRTLGVRPALGRDFVAADDSVGAPDVVMLSYELWTRRFNSDPAVIGKPLNVDGMVATIVGVTPQGFAFPPYGLGGTPGLLFTPYRFDAPTLKLRGNVFNSYMIARLAPGVSVEQATREANRVASGISHDHPEVFGRDLPMKAAAFPMHERVVSGAKRPMLLLLAAVTLVLLIACINVSSLVLARAAARGRELAVRTAIGATRARLVQQFLAESIVLVTSGLALALVIAKWGTRAIAALAPASLVQGYALGIDGRVLGFSALVSVVSALVFSLVPALRRSDRGIASELHDESRGSSAGRARQRGRRALVVSQIALALMVSAAAGLMLKSFVRARNADPGFDATHVLSFRLIAPDYRYARSERVLDVHRQVMDRLARLPGVTSVSAADHLPMVGGWHISFTPEGKTLAQTPLGTNNIVFPGFFETLKMRVIGGRTFSDADRIGTPPVALVNETLARRYWGQPDSALGKRVKWGSAQSRMGWKTIVGVVRDVKETSLDQETQPGIYMAALQQDSDLVSGALRNVAIVARTRGEPMALSNAVRRAVHEVDPEIPIADLTDASTAAFSTVASRRFGVLLLSGFATLGLLLTAVGIYGQMAYSVTQRQREIGVRLAIGATPGGVLRLVVGQSVRMALVGVAVGVAGALALAQLLQRLLFGVSPLDVPTFAIAVAVLLAVSVAATWLPAWRASRVDPALAMRAD